MVKAEAVIHREHVLELGVEIFERYTGGAVDPERAARPGGEAGGAAVRRSREVASWDHRKLAGTY